LKFNDTYFPALITAFLGILESPTFMSEHIVTVYRQTHRYYDKHSVLIKLGRQAKGKRF